MLVIIQQTISEVQMTKEELKPIDTSKYKITDTGQVMKITKDEMKNRISMALKDLLLQQGFEVICKENAELDCQVNRNKYCYSCINATDKCFKKEIGCPCEKYKSYKDENAELKEQLGDKFMQKQKDKADLVWKLKTANEQKASQLYKAKEILRKFLDAKSIEERCVAESEAEQFLKE